MPLQMDPEEFRKHGHAVVDWIAEYMAGAGGYPVLSRNTPGELTAQLPASGPENGEAMEAILGDFERRIVPGITHWNHPRFLGYFAVTGSGPGVLAESLAAALNVNGMLWTSSPAATELEQVTLDWLRQWLGLPEGLFGVIHDTASVNVLHALAAARATADPECRDRGAWLPHVVYISPHTHSSVEKAAMVLGIGREHVRQVPVDEKYRMRADLLAEAIHADRASGLIPLFVCATVGTTSVASIDPVGEIARVAGQEKLWLHVDASYAGTAAVSDRFRWLLAGAEHADSIVVNPHKWMLTPIDLSVLWVRDGRRLRDAFSLVPEYLRSGDGSETVNYMDYGVALGRRFRALKLWFVMRYFGRKRIAAMIESHIEMARQLAGWVDGDDAFELAAPVELSLVTFRYRGADDENRALLERINSSGIALLSHNVLDGRYVLRFAVGNAATTESDVRRVWEALRESAKQMTPR